MCIAATVMYQYRDMLSHSRCVVAVKPLWLCLDSKQSSLLHVEHFYAGMLSQARYTAAYMYLPTRIQ